MNIVLSGPGGAGKGTIVGRLLAADPALLVSRSWTTRARRPGEPEDAYVFSTAESFVAHRDAGGFLEWVEYLDYLQGTPVPDPPDGIDMLFDIDVYGARTVKEWDVHAILIFIDTPDASVQRARLEGRGDAPERVQQRLELATEERSVAAELGMTTVVNDDLDDAVAEVQALIVAARR